VTGLVLGGLVTITWVGAGALGVVALVFLYPHLPTQRIVASDLAHAVPLTLVAGLGIGGWARSTGAAGFSVSGLDPGDRDRQSGGDAGAGACAAAGVGRRPAADGWPAVGLKLALIPFRLSTVFAGKNRER
jgi:hypothetical protein